MHRIPRPVLVLSLVLAVAGCRPATGDLDAAARTAVIEGVLAKLQADYVFPGKAAEMNRAIRARLARGEYDRLALDAALADSLTAHLRAVSPDKHLEVVYLSEPPADAEAEQRQTLEDFAEARFGLEGVEILEGNVGLLDLRVFVPAETPGAEEAVAQVMDSLADTHALIIDLRRNRGGEASMVRLLASYLVGPEPVQLSSIQWRPGNVTEESWTRRRLRGSRYGPGRPVFLLTSSRTFSAAEALAYDMKALGRAVIVGETTGGGAHPAGLEIVSERFAVRVPQGRAINPVTGTNWEGTGVAPDIQSGPEDALQTAHLAALRALRAAAPRDRRVHLDRLIGQMDVASGM